jgi:hypothetical protein
LIRLGPLKVELADLVRTPDEFGSTADETGLTATPVAVSPALRVLSDEGAVVMLDVARRLEEFAKLHPRIGRLVRSGCQRSKWFRDLCKSPSTSAQALAST